MKSPEKPRSRRLDAYIRVSATMGREGERFLSPTQQEERIRAWAQANGHEVIAAHHELDVSGGKMDRPKLNEVMRRIDARETDGVVVFKLDRFGRTLIGSLELIERIHDRGALFASVSDGFDITTETGRLVLRILLSLAQFELERIREQWRSSRAAAIERGWHISGMPPYGYRRETEVTKTGAVRFTGPLVPDDVEAPVVATIFKMRAAGATWSQIRDTLNDAGTLTRGGHPWSSVHLIRMLDYEAYLGVAGGGHAGDASKPGAHPAIVEEEVWHAARRRRSMRAGLSGDAGSITRGIVRCAGCRYMMVGQPKPEGRLLLRCQHHAQTGGCPAPAHITASPANGLYGLDAYVVERMFAELERQEEIAFGALDVDLAGLRRAWETAKERYGEAIDDVAFEDEHGRQAYDRRISARHADVLARQETYEEAAAVSGALETPVAELRRMWHELPIDVQRKHIARAVRHVFVRQNDDVPSPKARSSEQSRRAYFDHRVHIVMVGDSPVDVPRQGRRDFVSSPFEFPPA